MVKITFPDGSEKEFQAGITALDVAKSISEGLVRAAVSAKINGKLCDLSSEIEADSKFEAVKFDSKEGKETYWHSTSHLMAAAVKRLFPNAKFAIGPSIEEGFYYDFDVETPFTPEDLAKIEAEMKKIASADLPFKRWRVTKEKALEMEAGQIYKEELIGELPEGEEITFYEIGDGGFLDLCRGPHVQSTGKIKSFKLLVTSGAYWRGDASNRMLQRIYGISFPEKKQLDEYLWRIEEAKKRDHRKLGRELDLFTFNEYAPGMSFWLPNGTILRNLLLEYYREEHRKLGYKEIITPIILNKDLWVTSGHWENYRENMYFLKIDDIEQAIKPMNCPGGLLVYKEASHSYKEFPLKVGEIGLVHRHELSGALSGLFRVRYFTQDDAHIFMKPAQLKDQIKEVVSLADRIYKRFGFDYSVFVSTKPAKSIGAEELWELSTKALKDALDEMRISYVVNEGDGAFYGPKIDLKLKDSLGRDWQCGTIQVDMNLPERFDLTYVDEDGSNNKRPVMIHRALYGSLERFIGVLTEHFAGAFPVWLSPEQVRVLPIADRHAGLAQEIADKLEAQKIRTSVDKSQSTLEYKIREAQMKKIPYMLVIGDKEVESGMITIRSRDGKVRNGVPLEEFQNEVLEKMRTRSLS
ncbi:MAG: threonine--tRNA ligase [archaeon]